MAVAIKAAILELAQMLFINPERLDWDSLEVDEELQQARIKVRGEDKPLIVDWRLPGQGGFHRH